jgi:hypothetical protein
MKIKIFNSISSLSIFLKFKINIPFKGPITSTNNYILQYNNHTLSCINQSKRIFKLNYTLHQNNINIDYLSINNDYYHKKKEKKICNKNDIILNETEYRLLKHSLFKHIEYYAIFNNVNKITIITHHNLKRYNYEIKEEGFIPTNINPYYIETVKYIHKYNQY